MKVYKRQIIDSAPLAQADPYMIKGNDGRYYLYATEGQLYSSDSLLEGWKYDGICLNMPGQVNCWAPSVMEIGGKYYMYYSSRDIDCTEEHGQKMRVAVSDSPKGPFEYVKDLMPPFSIDPHAVQTESGIFLFYCNNDYEDEKMGTRIMCDRLIDPFTLENKPACVIFPTLDEEIYMRDRYQKGRHWYTIEGAFYFHIGETHFLMYSGGCYQNPSYFVGYCTAYGAENADLRTLNWTKYPDEHTYKPLLNKNDFIEGTGHNSVIFDDGKCYIVYHGRDYEDNRPEEDTRSARIDEMVIDGEKLSVRMTR